MAAEMKQWVIGKTGSFDGLKLETAAMPTVGEHEVLVKFHAASLNYRDIMIVNVRQRAIQTGKFIANINAGYILFW